jgi:NAD(P)-dependent dehydrogenase (short-subunit alcohol dehydrogenase family)
MRDLRDKAVLVTGAASGIGRAAAIAFAREGACPLMLNDVDVSGLRETAGIIERLGTRVILLPADVSDPAAVNSIVEAALAEAGRIDVLVNVAGIGILAPVEDLDHEDWEKVLGVDLWGVINTVSAVYPHMIARREGHIVNVSSSTALFNPVLYLASYATAKRAVLGLSEALMLEARVHEVGVTCLCPGSVETPIQDSTVIKGFSEESRKLTGFAFYMAETPADTAASIVRAVKKDRFLVVTTSYAKAVYFFRRHFQAAWFGYMKRFVLLFDRAFSRYREPRVGTGGRARRGRRIRDVRGRSVLVTGAASGIGRATAIAFAEAGATLLLLNDIDEAGLAETARTIEALGSATHLLPADVSDEASVRRIVASAIEVSGGLDILVNVAGVVSFCPFEVLEKEDWDYELDVDLWGVINTVSAAYPHMIVRGAGHIVNVASASGLFDPVLYLAPYATAKYGVVGLSEALMLEGRVHNVGVTCVCPGSVETPIKDRIRTKGFSEEVSKLTRHVFTITTRPEDTARAIVRAVERDRFLVVTTGFAKACWFLRRHFEGAWFAFFRRFAPVFAHVFKPYRLS